MISTALASSYWSRIACTSVACVQLLPIKAPHGQISPAVQEANIAHDRGAAVMSACASKTCARMVTANITTNSQG